MISWLNPCFYRKFKTETMYILWMDLWIATTTWNIVCRESWTSTTCWTPGKRLRGEMPMLILLRRMMARRLAEVEMTETRIRARKRRITDKATILVPQETMKEDLPLRRSNQPLTTRKRKTLTNSINKKETSCMR